MTQEALRRAKEAFAIEAREVQRAQEIMDMDAFSKAVEALRTAPRIAASGCGHSGIACRHFAHLMCCIERPARFISPAEAVHGASGFLQPGDAIVLVSRGGKTKELLPIAEISRNVGYPNPLHFSKAFTAYYGVSPLHYRNQGGTSR